MWELAGGTFSGRARAPALNTSLWSNRRGRQLIGDLRVEEEKKKPTTESERKTQSLLGNYHQNPVAVVSISFKSSRFVS